MCKSEIEFLHFDTFWLESTTRTSVHHSLEYCVYAQVLFASKNHHWRRYQFWKWPPVFPVPLPPYYRLDCDCARLSDNATTQGTQNPPQKCVTLQGRSPPQVYPPYLARRRRLQIVLNLSLVFKTQERNKQIQGTERFSYSTVIPGPREDFGRMFFSSCETHIFFKYYPTLFKLAQRGAQRYNAGGGKINVIGCAIKE